MEEAVAWTKVAAVGSEGSGQTLNRDQCSTPPLAGRHAHKGVMGAENAGPSSWEKARVAENTCTEAWRH